MPTESRLGARAEVVRGTLEMLALKLLSEEPMHGWGLSLKLREISRDVFDVNQGSLYPALQAMTRRGWIRAEWRISENNRRARYYSITAEGRKQLSAEIEEWNRTSGAVNRVLGFAYTGGWHHESTASLTALFGRRRQDREMDEEMRFHLEMETKRLVDAGMTARDATQRARRAFGGVERHKDDTRDERGAGRWFDAWSDVR